ncbi:hypothetical protein NDU88_009356 [Pleurodeles waltl]|uniref:Receptor ligand binding region domain-containing protein n=1 Tax=Pleurodeles waltl TaxID=8319 RepID=A0AAV7NYU3_PLEWA|nr:hypothetical protein NDU88_009356 [Pleurodeles waltl]
MGHFGWTWIGMIISDDELGLQGGQEMKRMIEERGGCVAFIEKVHLSYARELFLHIVDIAQMHNVKVIIIHSPEVHVKMLMEAFLAQNVTDKVFVFSASFTLTIGLFRRETWKIFNGSLGLAPHATKMPDFEDFLSHIHPSRDPNDVFVKHFWEKMFKCKWPGPQETKEMTALEKEERSIFCSESQTLEKKHSDFFELYDLSYTYHTYLAVFALAHSLNVLMTCKPGRGPFLEGACADVHSIQPWQVKEWQNLMY